MGFAADTTTGDGFLGRRRAKPILKGTDQLVVNEIGWEIGFGVPESAVVILGAGGTVIGTVAGGNRLIADAV